MLVFVHGVSTSVLSTLFVDDSKVSFSRKQHKRRREFVPFQFPFPPVAPFSPGIVIIKCEEVKGYQTRQSNKSNMRAGSTVPFGCPKT